MKHLLSIEALSAGEIEELLQLGLSFKKKRGNPRQATPLKGKTWAMIFNKSSTRTRVSFEVGIRELGGQALFLGVNDIQMGRGESIEDTARVLSRYVHGAIIRTYHQSDVEKFSQAGTIPVINALTDAEHPTQILADLMTWAEWLESTGVRRPKKLIDIFKGRTVVYLGDAAFNMTQSWIFAAARLQFRIHIAAPKGYRPSRAITARAQPVDIEYFDDVTAASRNADLLYTDTWISMGQEDEKKKRLHDLAAYQVNMKAVRAARPTVTVMHCLPAYRDQEISSEVFEKFSKTIFDEAENRLHIHKAILAQLTSLKR